MSRADGSLCCVAVCLWHIRHFLPADDSLTGWSYSEKATLPKRVGWDYRGPTTIEWARNTTTV